MTIKIKRISIEKDGIAEEMRGGLGRVIHSYKKLKGGIVVELSEGVVTGQSELSVESVSEELQDELYNVLNKIENELNGVDTDESDKGIKFIVNFIDLTMKELELSSEEVKQGKRDVSNADKFAKKIADSLKRQQERQAILNEGEAQRVADELISAYKEYTLDKRNFTDNFKKAFNSINEAIDTIIKYRSYLAIESEEYRKTLEDEIKLQKSKVELLKEVEKE